MSVFELGFALDKYQHIMPLNSTEWNTFRKFRGESLLSEWTPMKVGIVPETSDRPSSDFPHLASHVPVFSDRAKAGLMPVLERYGEFLPLDYPDAAYYAYNVTKVINALDEEASDVLRLSTGRVVDVKRYQFLRTRVDGVVMFKLPQLLVSSVFVNETFVQEVARLGLEGFSFRMVWQG